MGYQNWRYKASRRRVVVFQLPHGLTFGGFVKLNRRNQLKTGQKTIQRLCPCGAPITLKNQYKCNACQKKKRRGGVVRESYRRFMKSTPYGRMITATGNQHGY